MNITPPQLPTSSDVYIWVAFGLVLSLRLLLWISTFSATLAPPLRHTRRRNLPSWAVFGLVLFLTVHLWTSTFSVPAHAAFYSAAEQFFTASFPQAAAAIPLIFNALRGIFLIYVAIALISVLNAFRQGEEWLTVARSPAAVVVVVALGDVLSTIIIA